MEENNFLYKGYLLVIERYGLYWSAECKELDYDNTGSSIPSLKDYFMEFVNDKLEKEKTEMKFIETFNYNGWDLDIYDNKGDYVGVNSDLHYLDKRILKTSLTEKFIQFIRGGRVNKKEEEDLLVTSSYEIVYRDYILKVKESSNNSYTGKCDAGWYGGKYTSLSLLVSEFRKFVDRNIEELVWEMKEKQVEKDKKIEELIKVISGLNKKLEDKDKKIERLKSKIAAVKSEINKAE